MRSSAEINAGVYNYCAVFFDTAREEILMHATWGPSLEEQNANKKRIESAIERAMRQSAFRPN